MHPAPFGTVVAVELKTGRLLWETPLGSIAGIPGPDLAAMIRPGWALPTSVVPSSPPRFIGASVDRSLHAYDMETGRELWTGALPQSAKATPISYRLASGDQFVAIAVGGGGAWGAGDFVVAFKLPR